MRMWQLGVLVLAAALTATLAGHSGQPADTKETAAEPFGTKLILVTTANTENTLKSVQVRKLGDRSFIVGTSVRDSTLTQEDFPGRTLWIPVADVQGIVEFDDLGQLRRIGNSKPEPNGGRQ